ncbi:Hypothetical protein ORPV_986 [Orpheovirus IHUMI-LCC2]|uniref:Protein kinase n=1 Tax=Orpheovirus IHUMI-LCC2 TaxID=2023057 RepID=A0A2I2L5X3_9VIRU|nr:Hypothetical protein ORPV_986 [Orpheovirus IHUMI-LCC2]SNW62890.1 Hypothetical protein ORPV_986 [Orpheovirus IHUMI-LCC2]
MGDIKRNINWEENSVRANDLINLLCNKKNGLWDNMKDGKLQDINSYILSDRNCMYNLGKVNINVEESDVDSLAIKSKLRRKNKEHSCMVCKTLQNGFQKDKIEMVGVPLNDNGKLYVIQESNPNNFYIGSVINSILPGHNMGHVGGFLCGNSLYHIREYCQYDNIKKYIDGQNSHSRKNTNSNIFGILPVELSKIFKSLSRYNFCYRSDKLEIGNIGGNMKVRLCDFSNSSITIDNNSYGKHSKYVKHSYIIPNLQNNLNRSYSLYNNEADMMNTTQGSYTYLLLTLFSHPTSRDFLLKNNRLKQLWDEIWAPSQINYINDIISEENGIKINKPIWIRDDILEYISEWKI